MVKTEKGEKQTVRPTLADYMAGLDVVSVIGIYLGEPIVNVIKGYCEGKDEVEKETEEWLNSLNKKNRQKGMEDLNYAIKSAQYQEMSNKNDKKEERNMNRYKREESYDVKDAKIDIVKKIKGIGNYRLKKIVDFD